MSLEIATLTPYLRRKYSKDTKCTMVTCQVNGYVPAAYQVYTVRVYGVPATLLSYLWRMCGMCTEYRRCHVRTTYFMCARNIRNTSAYAEYELRLQAYKRRMRDSHAQVDTQYCVGGITNAEHL